MLVTTILESVLGCPSRSRRFPDGSTHRSEDSFLGRKQCALLPRLSSLDWKEMTGIMPGIAWLYTTSSHDLPRPGVVVAGQACKPSWCTWTITLSRRINRLDIIQAWTVLMLENYYFQNPGNFFKSGRLNQVRTCACCRHGLPEQRWGRWAHGDPRDQSLPVLEAPASNTAPKSPVVKLWRNRPRHDPILV
jgi:hypothetical protein